MQKPGRDVQVQRTVIAKAQAMVKTVGCAFYIKKKLFKFSNSVVSSKEAIIVFAALFYVPLAMLLGGLNTNLETASAAPSSTLNFQGRLLDIGGGLVSDGFYDIEFNLYEDSSGGSSLWTETWDTGTTQVRVTNGYFSVYLGEHTSFPGTIDWSDDKFLTMNVEADGEMDPRFKLTAVPYAFSSSNVKSADTDSANSNDVSITSGNTTTSGNSGNINIDVGNAVGSNGNISLGSANASALLFGNSTTNPNFTFQGTGTLTIDSLNCTSFTNGGALTANGSGVISCSNDDGGAGAGTTLTVNSTATSSANLLNVTATGSVAGTTWTLNSGTPDDITLAISDASATLSGVVTANAQTFGGVKTFNSRAVLGAGLTVSASQSLRLIGGNIASRPAPGTDAGTLYYDTETDQLLHWSETYNGSGVYKWKADRGEYFIVAANDSSNAEKASADFVADGTADQVEINDALTQGAGGKVLLLAGSYTINGSVTVPANTMLSGSGKGTVITIAASLNPAGLNMVNTTSANVVVRDLTINGNDENQATSGVVTRGVYSTGENTSVDNVNIMDIETSGVYLSGAHSRAINNYIDCDVSVSSNVATGIYTSGINAIVSKNNLKDCYRAIEAYGDYVNIEGNSVYDGAGSYGIYLDTSNYSVVDSNVIFGNFDYSYGIYITSSSRVSVSNNTVQEVTLTMIGLFSTTYSSVTGNVLDNGNGGASLNLDASSSNNTVTGNLARDTAPQGRMLIYSSNNAISGNTIVGGRLYIVGGSYNTVSGNSVNNTASGAEGDGVQVSGDGNIIVGNIMHSIPVGNYGIDVSSGTGNYLADNKFGSGVSSTTLINDAGTNTVYAGQTTSGNGNFRFRGSANSTTAFAVQNAAGVNVLNVDSTNGEVELGNYNGGTNPVSGKLVVANSTNANTITIRSGVTSASYDLYLPTTAGAVNECLKNDGTTPGTLIFGSCGSATTLQGAYTAGSAGDQVIALSSTNDSIIFRNPASSGTDSGFVANFDQLNTGAVDSVRINNAGTGNLLGLYDSGTLVARFADGGHLLGASTSTATTGTTEATARTNVTTVTLTAAGSFANNDVILIDNAGQDYYTRIVSGGGTTTLTVSPAVSYDVSATVTKYNIQNIGATASDYTTQSNRFFQGYFLGGVVAGAGSTTLSDGRLASTGALNLNTASSTTITGGATSNILNVNADNLTTGNGLRVSSSSGSLLTGNVAKVEQTGTYVGSDVLSGNTLSVNRSITNNFASSSAVTIDTANVTYDLANGGNYNAGRSVSHTVAAHSNQVLVVEVTSRSLGPNTIPTNVTYNGKVLTNLGSVNNSNQVGTSVWYIVNPDVTTANVTVTMPGTQYFTIRAFGLYNVDQTTPLTGFQSISASQATYSLNIASATDDLVLDAISAKAYHSSAGGGQTIRYQTAIFGDYSVYGSSKPGAAGTVTISNTRSSTDQAAYAAYNVKAASSPGLSVTGAALSVTSNCTEITGTCYDSSNVLSVSQNFVTSSGTVLSVQGAGTGDLINLIDGASTVLRVADGGATTLTANGGSNVALTVNNGASTGNSINIQDAGTTVLNVASGGTVNVTGAKATTGDALKVTGDNLTTGNALHVSSSSNTFTTGNLLQLTQDATFTGLEVVQGNVFNIARNLTNNNAASPAVYTEGYTQSNATANTNTRTVSHTVNARSNQVLIVEIPSRMLGGSGIPTSVTFNGDSLTMYGSVTSPSSATASSVWYIVNPDQTTANIVVTLPNNAFASVHATNAYNVDQTAPLTGLQTVSSSATSASVGVASGIGDQVYDLLSSNAGPVYTQGAGQTERFEDHIFGDWTTWGSVEPGAAGTVTMSTSNGTTQQLAYLAYNIEALPQPLGITVTGAAASISSDCTEVAGTCYDQSTVLEVNQNFVTSTGTVFSLTGAGTGDLVNLIDGSSTVLRVADGGATTITANGGTNVALTVNNGTSTGSIFRAQDNGATVASIADGGATTFQNTTNSTSAFQVQNASGTNTVLNVDTVNNRLGVGTATPVANFDVTQAANSTTTLNFGYGSVPVSGTTAFADLSFKAQTSPNASWTTSYTSSNARLASLAIDQVNGVIYTGSYGGGDVYRCDITATDCDANGDWTNSSSVIGSWVYDLEIDTDNQILYASTNNAGIYRCDITSTACDAPGDWTNVATTNMWGLYYDDVNNVMYSGTTGTGEIYRCDTTTDCDVPGDWVSVYDSASTQIFEYTIDTTNNILYAAGSASMYRCDLSTDCDASGDWAINYTSVARTLIHEPASGVLYSSTTSGNLIRCDTTTDCDATGDWTTSFTGTNSGVYDIALDTLNDTLYFVTHDGTPDFGAVYSCALVTDCNENGDWSQSAVFTQNQSESLAIEYDETNSVVYVATGWAAGTGMVKRYETGSGGITVDYANIKSYATDTSNGVADGALGFTTLVGGTSVQGFYLQGGTGTLGTSTVAGALNISDGTGANSFSVSTAGLATAQSGLTVTTGSTFTNASSSLFTAIAIANLDYSGSGNTGAIGTAAATVNVATTFNINQTTASQTLTLPNPTLATSGRIAYINNVGSTPFTMYSQTITNGDSATFIWNGTAWRPAFIAGAGGGGGVTTLNSATGALTIANASESSGTITIDSAGSGTTGLVTAGAQTFGGAKTFNGGVVVAANQSLRLIGGNIASRPAPGTDAGTLYYDTETDQLLHWSETYDGSGVYKWKADRGEYYIVAANDSSDEEKASADFLADGTSDETEINLALTQAAGGKVLLLAGTYVADGTILVPNNTTLAGVGSGTVIQLADIDPTSLNLIEATGTSRTGQTVRDIKLDGRKDLNTASSQIGIYFLTVGDNTANLPGATVTNVSFDRFSSHAIHLDNSDNSVVTSNTIIDPSGHGIYVDASSYVNVANNIMYSTDTGVYLDGSDHITVTGNTIEQATTGIYGNGADNNVINANIVQGAFAFGIRLHASDTNVLSNNRIEDPDGSSDFNGIYFTGSASYNSITGNVLSDTSCDTTCFAINISVGTAVKNYLEGNRYWDTDADAGDDASINDVGANTIYVNQQTNTVTGEAYDVTDFRIQGSANSATALEVNDASGTAVLTVNTSTAGITSSGTLTVTGTSALNGTVTVGVSGATEEYLVLDNYDSATNGAPSGGANGAMYYDTDLNKFRCYENDTWINCIGSGAGGGSSTQSVILHPEFDGVILSADGSNNSGALISDIEKGLGSTDGYAHNFYEWTTSQTSLQDYDITVRYTLPADFNTGFNTGSWKIWTKSSATADTAITFTLEDNDFGTSCVSESVEHTGTDWEQITITNPSGCTFAAGDTITMTIKVSAQNDATMRVGEIEFSYDN